MNHNKKDNKDTKSKKLRDSQSRIPGLPFYREELIETCKNENEIELLQKSTNIHSLLCQKAFRIQEWKDEMDVKMQELERQNRNYKLMTESLRKANADLQFKTDNNKEEINKFCDQHNDIQNKIDITRELCNLLKTFATNIEDQIKTCKVTKDLLDESLYENTVKFQRLLEKYKMLEISMHQDRKDYKESIENYEQYIETFKSNKESEIFNLEQRLNENLAIYEKLKIENENISKDLENAKNEIKLSLENEDQLTSKLHVYEKEINDYDILVSHKVEEITNLKEENDVMHTNIMDLFDIAKNLFIKYDDTEHNFEVESDETITKMDIANLTCTNLKKLLDDICLKILKLSEESTEMKTINESLENDKDKYLKEINDLRAKIAYISDQKVETDKINNDLLGTIQTLSQNLSDNKEVLERLLLDKKQLDLKMIESHNMLEESIEKYQNLMEISDLNKAQNEEKSKIIKDLNDRHCENIQQITEQNGLNIILNESLIERNQLIESLEYSAKASKIETETALNDQKDLGRCAKAKEGALLKMIQKLKYKVYTQRKKASTFQKCINRLKRANLYLRKRITNNLLSAADRKRLIKEYAKKFNSLNKKMKRMHDLSRKSRNRIAKLLKDKDDDLNKLKVELDGLLIQRNNAQDSSKELTEQVTLQVSSLNELESAKRSAEITLQRERTEMNYMMEKYKIESDNLIREKDNEVCQLKKIENEFKINIDRLLNAKDEEIKKLKHEKECQDIRVQELEKKVIKQQVTYEDQNIETINTIKDKENRIVDLEKIIEKMKGNNEVNRIQDDDSIGIKKNLRSRKKTCSVSTPKPKETIDKKVKIDYSSALPSKSKVMEKKKFSSISSDSSSLNFKKFSRSSKFITSTPGFYDEEDDIHENNKRSKTFNYNIEERKSSERKFFKHRTPLQRSKSSKEMNDDAEKVFDKERGEMGRFGEYFSNNSHHIANGKGNDEENYLPFRDHKQTKIKIHKKGVSIIDELNVGNSNIFDLTFSD